MPAYRPLDRLSSIGNRLVEADVATYMLPWRYRGGTNGFVEREANCFSRAQAPLTRLKTNHLAGILISASKLPSGRFLFHTLRSRHCAEHAPKNRIDVLQVIAEVEQRFQRRHW